MSLLPSKGNQGRSRQRRVPFVEGLEQRALLAKFVLAPSGGIGSTASLVTEPIPLPQVDAVGTSLPSEEASVLYAELAKVDMDVARLDDFAVTSYRYHNSTPADVQFRYLEMGINSYVRSESDAIFAAEEPTVTASGEIGTSRSGSASDAGSPITFRIEPTEGDVLGDYVVVAIDASFGSAGGSLSQVEYSASYSLGNSNSQTLISGTSLSFNEPPTTYVSARIGDELNLTMLLRSSATWPGTEQGQRSANPGLTVRMEVQKASRPDLQVSQFARAEDGGLLYQIQNVGVPLVEGGPLYSQDSKLAAYWASGPSAGDVIPGLAPVYMEPLDTLVEKLPGLYPANGPLHVPVGSLNLASRPGNATHLVFVVDSDNQVVETDEANNTSPLEVEMAQQKPDIKVVSLAWNGVDGDVAYLVEVAGNDLVVDADVGLYWAKGPTVNDILSRAFGRKSVKSVGSYGPFFASPEQFEGIPEGATHILAVADRFDLFAESDESNNVAYIVVGKPDIAPVRFSYFRNPDETGDVKGPLPVNWSFGVEFEVSNIGALQASRFSISIYLSCVRKDGSLIEAEVATVSVIGLNPGGLYAMSLNGLTIPSEFAKSAYGRIRIGMKLDSQDEVEEVSESNNYNVGGGVDWDSTALYDPVYTSIDFVHSGFRSYAAFTASLRRDGYVPLSANALVNLWNTGFLSARYYPGFHDWHNVFSPTRTRRTIRSSFDNSERPMSAFRSQVLLVSPRIHKLPGHSRQFLVIYQGNERRNEGEPNPFYALRRYVSERTWFDYVRDWHRRF